MKPEDFWRNIWDEANEKPIPEKPKPAPAKPRAETRRKPALRARPGGLVTASSGSTWATAAEWSPPPRIVPLSNSAGITRVPIITLADGTRLPVQVRAYPGVDVTGFTLLGCLVDIADWLLHDMTPDQLQQTLQEEFERQGINEKIRGRNKL